MKDSSYASIQQDMPDQGRLQITVQDGVNNHPIENARVRISYTGVPDNILEDRKHVLHQMWERNQE